MATKLTKTQVSRFDYAEDMANIYTSAVDHRKVSYATGNSLEAEVSAILSPRSKVEGKAEQGRADLVNAIRIDGKATRTEIKANRGSNLEKILDTEKVGSLVWVRNMNLKEETRAWVMTMTAFRAVFADGKYIHTDKRKNTKTMQANCSGFWKRIEAIGCEIDLDNPTHDYYTDGDKLTY